MQRTILNIGLCIFLIWLSLVDSIANVNHVNYDLSKRKVAKYDSIYLFNKSSKSIDFYYANEFKDLVTIHILPLNKYSLASVSEVCLIQSNKFQTQYILNPGESLTIELSNSGNAILRTSNNQYRNDELDLLRIMNESVKLKYFDLLMFYKLNINSNYKKIDSIYQVDLNERMTLLNNYVIKYNLNEVFAEKMRLKLVNNYYSIQMGLAINSKKKIDEVYLKYLDSLCSSIEIKYNGLHKQTFDKELLYACFLYKNRDKRNSDTLFINSKKEENEDLKDEIQFTLVKNELEKNAQSSKWFISDFIENSQNVHYKEYINNLLESTKLSAINGNEDIVLTTSKHVEKIKSIFEKLKGKIIYIDTWASWCLPCRAAMGDSKKIRQYFSGKQVEFVYFSIDENTNSWLEAVKQEKLEDVNHVFLMLSFSKSKFKELFKITTIPRYIILDKSGSLVTSNAPKPGDPKLITLLNKLAN